MGDVDNQRFLNWLSRLNEAEPVTLQADHQPSASFTFEGIPVEKQPFNVSSAPRTRSPHANPRQRTLLDFEKYELPHLPARPITRGTASGLSRKERNGYERIPRAKTKEDRYEYKGKASRAKSDRAITAQKRRSSGQKRKHTINEDFRASNVPSSRLTLRSATNLGIFNKGRRSSPAKTRAIDHSFSETDFLKNLPMRGQPNRPSQYGNKRNMFDYDFELGETRWNYNEACIEPQECRIKEAPQHQPRIADIGLESDDASAYHGPENGPAPKVSPMATTLINEPPLGQETDTLRKDPMSQPHARQNTPSLANDHSKQLLDFDLYTSQERIDRNQVERYWTLEDLNCLLEQRISLWRAEDAQSMPALTGPEQNPRKRKCDSSQDQATSHAKMEMKRFNKHKQIIDPSPGNKISDPSTAILAPSLLSVGVIDYPMNKPPSRGGQRDHIVDTTGSQQQRPCWGRAPHPLHNEDAYLTSEALDAAYEAVIRSELEASHDSLDYDPIIHDCIGTEREYITSVSPAPCELSWEGAETLDPSHTAQESLLSHREGLPVLINTRKLYGSQAPHHPIGSNLAWEAGQALGRYDPDPRDLNFSYDPLQNFWQQNKLY